MESADVLDHDLPTADEREIPSPPIPPPAGLARSLSRTASAPQGAFQCGFLENAEFETPEQRDCVHRFCDLVCGDWGFLMYDNPVFGTQCGHHEHNDRLQSLNVASFEYRAAHAARLKEKMLLVLEQGLLPRRMDLWGRMLVDDLGCLSQNVAAGLHLVLKLNSLEHGGIVNDLPEALEWTLLEEPEHWEQLRRRISQFPAQVNDLISLMRESTARGFRPALPVLQGLPSKLRRTMRKLPQAITDAVQSAPTELLRDALELAVERCWVKGLEQLLEFLEREHLPLAIPEPGLCSQQQGDLLYRAYLRYNLGSQISPEEIHAKGLQEVHRIKARLCAEVFPVLNHTGSIYELGARLRADQNQQFRSAEELQASFERKLDRIREFLPDMFQKLPEAQLQVRTVEDSGCPVYIAGTVDGIRPGITYIPAQPLDQQPAYEQAVYALHEGIPGHHLQNSLNTENAAMPNFLRILEERRYEWMPVRRQVYMAYQEGWALYAEALGEEMGRPLTEGAVYDTAESLFGRLSCEMSRAVRLVVDTGIHAFHWSLERASQYMEEQTGMHKEVCDRAMCRYAAWPGQAVAYKIGQLRILELREHAEQELGDRFELKWFHSQVLQDGPMPLDLLEEHIKAAVAQYKAGGE